MGTDFYRDTNIRYLGYTNEVGEALRPVIPRYYVNLSYKIAFAYVCADTMHKTCNALQREGPSYKVLFATGDALLWQTLASVVIPGFTINRISKFTGNLLAKTKKIPTNLKSTLTVVAGLAAIPLVVKPIDMAVTLFMNCTYRQYFK